MTRPRFEQVDLLLPFSLPPAELAGDLLRNLEVPSLAMMLARAAQINPIEVNDAANAYARSLPHERWLCGALGLPTGIENSPPVATRLMQRDGLHPIEGYWFVLQPVHVHIARDHLVLTDARQLELDEEQARTLFAEAAPLFAEADMALVWGCTRRWYVRADGWRALSTATPDAACGRNIDIWLPRGDAARSWRKLQNEVQMQWHTSSVNEAREARGAKPINALWLWGGAEAEAKTNTNTNTNKQSIDIWQAQIDAPDWAAGASRRYMNINDMFSASADSTFKRTLLLADGAAEAALGNDWGEWLLRMKHMEDACFAPLLAALQDGQIARLTLVLSDHVRLSEYTLTRLSLRKFWHRPSLARLVA